MPQLRPNRATRHVTVGDAAAAIPGSGSTRVARGGPGGDAAPVRSALRPGDLRTEGVADPIGLGTPEPRLSWRLIPRRGSRGIRQDACQVEVRADGPGAAAEAAGMVGSGAGPGRPGPSDGLPARAGPRWDSGRVPTDAPWLIYAGPALESRQRCRWRVRVWDGGGRVSPWSAWATFEMGLLRDEDRRAAWIGAVQPGADARLHLRHAHRIWVAPHLGDPDRAGFRRTIALDGAGPASARLRLTGGARRAWIDGRPVWASPVGAGSGRPEPTSDVPRGTTPVATTGWQADVDVTGVLHPGRIVLAVEACREPGSPPGLLAELVVTDAAGVEHRTCSDGAWTCAADPAESWQTADDDDGAWPLARPVARWGDPPWGRDPALVRPPRLLRRRFTVGRLVRRARIYASALGVYELRFDGSPVSDERMAPGWTDFRQRVEYQAFDVTPFATPGEHVLGAVLADGWYAGHVGLWGPGRYGPDPLFWCRLEIEFEDGGREVVASDEHWEAAEGAIRYADLLMGQTIDHRRRDPAWDGPAAADAWTPVRVGEHAAPLVARVGPPVRVTMEVPPARIETRPDGSAVVDLGQNVVGWIRLAARGPAGRRILLRHAEALEPDGSLLLATLRSAQALDEFILGGEGEEVFEPTFTYHGFRFVEVTGYPGVLDPASITACVVHADMPVTGGFACSHPGLTRLQRNITWGQRGNFLSVPTDCPQRDERLGWTGDAQVFASTAAFNMDVRRFFDKWLEDVRDAQHPDGAIPDVVPEMAEIGAGAAGWGDAVTIVPWTLHRHYADERVVRRALPAILRWLEYLAGTSEGHVRPASGYGDWLSVDADTPKDLVGTAYFAYSARLAAELAQVMGRGEDAAACTRRFEEIRRAFRERFVQGGGLVESGTQTACVVALRVGLLEPEEIPLVVERLVADIRNRNWHLSTGFLGTPWLLPALAEGGRLDVAYRLLLADTYPSWLYQVRQGATTMWERWDGFTDGKGFHTSLTTAGIFTDVMNSLNHYAYGSVGAFMYAFLGGLRLEAPGYERVRIEPRPAPGVSWARTWVHSVRGRIACGWRAGTDDFRLDLWVPPGVTAEVVLPGSPDAIEEGAVPLAAAAGVAGVRDVDGETVAVVGSGRYHFRVRGRGTS